MLAQGALRAATVPCANMVSNTSKYMGTVTLAEATSSRQEAGVRSSRNCFDRMKSRMASSSSNSERFWRGPYSDTPNKPHTCTLACVPSQSRHSQHRRSHRIRAPKPRPSPYLQTTVSTSSSERCTIKCVASINKNHTLEQLEPKHRHSSS